MTLEEFERRVDTYLRLSGVQAGNFPRPLPEANQITPTDGITWHKQEENTPTEKVNFGFLSEIKIVKE